MCTSFGKMSTKSCGQTERTCLRPSSVWSSPSVACNWLIKAGTIASTATLPPLLTRTPKAFPPAFLTESSGSQSASSTVGRSSGRYTASCDFVVASRISVRPAHTPHRVETTGEVMLCCKIGTTLGRIRSPSFLTSSPRHLPAIMVESSSPFAKSSIDNSISGLRISTKVLGVLGTRDFHTESAAVLTVRAGSLLDKYNRANTSHIRSSPTTCCILAASASDVVLGPAFPSFRRTLLESPETFNRNSPRRSTELWRILQFELNIPFSTAGSSIGKDDFA
mmetsp:Transcript_3421/g.21399  ORF Transcript_3421/g.21399 Transcript_3421/m.21399 type:complete len:279 (-) Transcript_3421:5228-6064(-)